jgi:hypothetical protein
VQLFNAKTFTGRFRESVRNIQLGITSLKRVVRLIPSPGVVNLKTQTPGLELYRSESAKCTGTSLLLQRRVIPLCQICLDFVLTSVTVTTEVQTYHVQVTS